MKKVKILTILLAIALVTMVAFFGIYVPTQNRMENNVKNYSYMMDLKGARNVVLSADKSNKTIIKDSEGKEVEDSDNLTDEEIAEKGYKKEEVPQNNEDALNIDNYNKSKDVIEKRLKELKMEEYNIRLDESNGDILLQIPENDSTDDIVTQLVTKGRFEIIDSETEEVLMDSNDIDLVNVMYGSGSNTTSATSSGTTVYLNIEFNKEGTNKLKDISNKYVKNENEKTSDEEVSEDVDITEDKESTASKEVTLKINDEKVLSTSFEEPMETGKLQLSMGKATTDQDALQDNIKQASNIAVSLNNGEMPIKYTAEKNEYILSDITSNELNIVVYVTLGLVFIALILLIFKYKMNGFLGAISYIGLISVFLLLIRYANVDISLQGILGIFGTLIFNYIFIFKFISKIKDNDNKSIGEKIKETYKEFFIRIVPICIAIIVFCFGGWATLSSFGMIMFWGIALILIYNAIVTNLLLRINNNK